jgi:hypothetical protein
MAATPKFADFLRKAHKIIHELDAGKDPSKVFDIGYSLGRLTAHYKRKMTEQEAEEFDKGMMDGYAVGHLTRLH